MSINQYKKLINTAIIASIDRTTKKLLLSEGIIFQNLLSCKKIQILRHNLLYVLILQRIYL